MQLFLFFLVAALLALASAHVNHGSVPRTRRGGHGGNNRHQSVMKLYFLDDLARLAEVDDVPDAVCNDGTPGAGVSCSAPFLNTGRVPQAASSHLPQAVSTSPTRPTLRLPMYGLSIWREDRGE